MSLQFHICNEECFSICLHIDIIIALGQLGNINSCLLISNIKDVDQECSVIIL